MIRGFILITNSPEDLQQSKKELDAGTNEVGRKMILAKTMVMYNG